MEGGEAEWRGGHFLGMSVDRESTKKMGKNWDAEEKRELMAQNPEDDITNWDEEQEVAEQDVLFEEVKGSLAILMSLELGV